MNRLKVLVFALIALGLWVFSLSTLSSALASKAVDEASAPLLAATGAVAARIEANRSALQGALLKLASNPVLVQKNTGRVEAPTAERFTALRTAAYEGLSEPARATATVVLVNDQGALMAVGNAEPAPAPDGFDVKGAVAGGGDGVLVEMNGTPCLFVSVPMVGFDRGEVRAVGSVLLGAPLWGSFATADALADSVNKDLKLNGVGLWLKGKRVGVGGKKDAVEKAFKDAKPGQTTVVERGTVDALGPLKLPLFIDGANALDVVARRDVPGTPLEVVAIASARPFMESLAAAQKISLLLALGLLAAGIVFTLLVSSGPAENDDKDAEDEEAVAPKRVGTPSVAGAASVKNRVEPLPGALSLQPPAPAPEASPEDFNFPPHSEKPSPAALSAPFDGPADDPFASGAPRPNQNHAAKAQTLGASLGMAEDDYENQRTTAYPAHRSPSMMESTTDSQPAVDPFSLASGVVSEAQGEDNPDATRVATIPPELLKSARRDVGPATAANTAPRSAAPAVTAPRVQAVAAGGDDEQHFQETFRDFLSARQKCGEPNDGMTYDKFAAKLRKNKEQLVAKYACRTVRFQVYVKDGKAALKATPVKD